MTARDIRVIESIQTTRAKELERERPLPLGPEGRALAEHKRFTFDIIATPVDPLR